MGDSGCEIAAEIVIDRFYWLASLRTVGGKLGTGQRFDDNQIS